MGPVRQGVLYEPWLTKEQGSSQKASQRTYYWRGRGGGPCMIYSIKVPLHGGSEIASPPQGSSLSFTPIPLVRETAAGRGLAGSRHCTERALAAQHTTRERHPPSTATEQAWGLSPFYELGN